MGVALLASRVAGWLLVSWTPRQYLIAHYGRAFEKVATILVVSNGGVPARYDAFGPGGFVRHRPLQRLICVSSSKSVNYQPDAPFFSPAICYWICLTDLAIEHKMKKALILLTVALTLMGCDGMSRSQKGALTGAALGSGIGLVAGGSAGQVIGAGLIGGAAGYIVGSIP